jgi:hypothetical protein
MLKRSFYNRILCNCLLPLLVGAIVYLFFRPPNFLSRFFVITPAIEVKSAVLQQLFFVLPDFCWSYSLACALFLFFSYYQYNLRKAAVRICILVVGSELVQLAFPLYFTFDPFDLAATLLAFVLSWLQLGKLSYEKES